MFDKPDLFLAHFAKVTCKIKITLNLRNFEIRTFIFSMGNSQFQSMENKWSP